MNAATRGTVVRFRVRNSGQQDNSDQRNDRSKYFTCSFESIAACEGAGTPWYRILRSEVAFAQIWLMTGSGERTFSPSPRKFPTLLPGSPKRAQARVKLLLQRVRLPARLGAHRRPKEQEYRLRLKRPKSDRSFVIDKQKAAESFAGSFAPKTRLALFLRNQASKAFRVPSLAKLALQRNLVDRLTFPDYFPKPRDVDAS